MMNENTLNKKISSLSDIANRQQHQASNPKRSVWVEASAGTGKTKVLTDRVLRLFLDGVRPDQILCLTYTKAAAVEMNDRISTELSKWAVMPYRDETQKKDLYRTLKKLTDSEPDERLVHRARTLFALCMDVPGGLKIQTIHGFCQEILKRFPLEAGVLPYFSLMDDRMASEVLDEVSVRLLQRIEHEPNTPSGRAMMYLTDHLGESAFSDVMEILVKERAKILRMLSGYPNFEAYLSDLQKHLELPDRRSRNELLDEFAKNLDPEELRKMAVALANGTKTDQQRSADLVSLIENPAEFDFQNYWSIFCQKEKRVPRPPTKPAREMTPDLAEKCRREAERLIEFRDLLDRARLFEATASIMTIAEDLATAYTAYKQKNARLDYEDLIIKTRSLLENKNVSEWILFKLDSAINHILVDEAQDTSPDQWAIIKALSEDFFAGEGGTSQQRTIFVVGDRKQSIYSFQGADPAKFDEMRRYFASRAKNFDQIRLDVSFRSTSAVLETVNRLFSFDNARSGVVIDQEKVEHLPYRLGEAGRVEVWPLVEGEKKDPAPDEPSLKRKTRITATTRLAVQIARHIKQMVESRTILKSKNRPVRYGDFMVLVQRRNAFGTDFIRECKNIGVNIAGLDKIKLSDQIAVADLLSLGRFLLLPEDDLSLAEVLKSPIFNLTDDDLFDLCYRRRDSLWQSLRFKRPDCEAVQILNTLLEKVDFVRPFELFDYVLTACHGRQRFAERLGSEVEDALDEFMNLALTFEEEHIPELQGFIRWMSEDDVEIKREQEQSGADLVRLITVHGSKGLQAPIVILPDTTRVAFQKREKKLLWEDENTAYFPLDRTYYEGLCERLFEKKTEESFDEYRRLLYVALTRAEDCLYVCGYANDGKYDERSWYALCRQTLESCGFSEENGNLSFSSPQEVPQPISELHEIKLPTLDRPEWLDETAPLETALSKPYMPSRPEDEDDLPADSPLIDHGNRFRRGLLIHRILQSLSLPAESSETANFVHLYLKVNAPESSERERTEIASEILKIYDDPRFSFLFGPQSYAEVPVAGEVDGHLISGQIDRLYVGQDDVAVIDFKTNRPAAETPEEIPSVYRRQLDLYGRLMAKIYPQKQVKTYILWTNTLNLMEIS